MFKIMTKKKYSLLRHENNVLKNKNDRLEKTNKKLLDKKYVATPECAGCDNFIQIEGWSNYGYEERIRGFYCKLNKQCDERTEMCEYKCGDCS